jgi:hypothetical protein
MTTRPAPRRSGPRFRQRIPSEVQAREDLALQLARGRVVQASFLSRLPLFEVALNGAEALK